MPSSTTIVASSSSTATISTAPSPSLPGAPVFNELLQLLFEFDQPLGAPQELFGR